MSLYLLLAALIILTCIIMNRISSKLGVPMLLAFILLGMFFGSDGVVKIAFDNYEFAESICSIALIFIMFYGGFGTNFKEARPILCKSILLSSFGVVFTSLFTSLFCHYALHINWIESLLIASIIGSTDAASVFSILRSKKLNLKYNTASMLEVESGSNDPFAYMLMITVLSISNGQGAVGSIAGTLISQILFGVLGGFLIAYLSLYVLKRFRFTTDGFDTVFVVAVALVSYALVSLINGNGYLSVYIVGIILGNAKIKNKKTFVSFFDGLTGLMQMLIFFLLGLLSFPSRLPKVFIPALLIALFLTFVARPLAVFMILSPFRCSIPQKLVVSWAGLRGAASIVFAVMAMLNISTQNDIFHIVFGIVLFSILLQGSLLPLIAKKLKMIDEHGNVMKTFNDYTDEAPVQFIKSMIPKNHSWCGMKLKEILLPPDTILVLLLRNDKQIVPNGETTFMEGDILILCAKSSDHVEGVELSEKHIDEENEWVGKKLFQISTTDNMLIILIKRQERVVIPKGDTIIHSGDVLVLNQMRKM